MWCKQSYFVRSDGYLIFFDDMFGLSYFMIKNAESDQMIKVARSMIDACVVNKLYMIEISSLSYPCAVF